MEMNELPRYDTSDNPTGCCPRFKPEGWDGQELHFEKKRFLKAKTRSLFYIPINMGFVFPKTFAAIKQANAYSDDDFVILSCDPSAWTGEHYFAITKDVPGHELVTMSGDFLTKVFEGPYKKTPDWEKEMQRYVQDKGRQVKQTYFFYTSCPKCAKTYGKNYVVAISQLR